jgi:hypothetical protein
MRLQSLSLVSLGAGVLLLGCGIATQIDRDDIPGGETTTAGGGMGGSVGGMGDMAGAGGMGGSGMGGSGVGGSGGSDSCTDNAQNGDETAVDCGGSCPPCIDGMACMVADDCASRFCDNMVCSACTMVSDCPANTYCLTGACVARKANGVACTMAEECLANICMDDVCCAEACTEACKACDVANSEGTCSFVPSGQDPDMECPGPQTCDGAGMCMQ